MRKMHLSTNKLKRLERKKKKLAALIEMSELNNKDRSELSPKSGAEGDSGDMSNSLKRLAADYSDDKTSSPPSPGAGEGDATSPGEPHNQGVSSHRKKKKRKSRHREGEGEGSSQSESSIVGLQKRKSSTDIATLIHQPIKILKHQKDSYQKAPTHIRFDDEGSSFADELASFKRDRDRSRKRAEKREQKEAAQNQKGTEPKQSNKEAPQTTGEQDIEELKAMLRARKKQLKELPTVRLKAAGKDADLSMLEERVPILPNDVQSFLMLCQLGHDTHKYPRWIELKKFNRLSKTVVLVVEGASAYDLFAHESQCRTLTDMDVRAEMVSPYCYNCSIVDELCAVPLTSGQKRHLESKFGKEICPEALLTDNVIKVLRSAFSISCVPKTKTEAVEKKIAVPTTDKFPRTELLLSTWQLIEEGYPLPFSNTELGNRYPDYVMTKDQYAEVTPSSPMWALDCEMCLTRAGNELTRVSVVNEQHQTVYESLCLPPNPIKNYLTEYSGITAEMMRGVTTRLEDIQRDLRELFPPDVILVGQSLNGDLHALKMMHPYVIDTSVIFNLTGERRRKSKLSKLSEEFLKEQIQQRGAEGHDSVEDSLAALKLVQHKLTKSLEYGDAVLSGLRRLETPSMEKSADDASSEHHAGDFDDIRLEVGPTIASSLFKHFTMHKRTVSVVGQEEMLAAYSAFTAAARRENTQLMRTVTTESNQQTVARVCHESKSGHFTLGHVVLSEEEDIKLVDSWVQRLYDSPPFNSLIVVVLAGSHKSFANGAVLLKIKKPNLRLSKHKKID